MVSQHGVTACNDESTHLVVTSAEHELGIRIVVEDALDDLALVDRYWADLEVLLADEDCTKTLVELKARIIRDNIPSIGRFRAKLFSSRS